MDLSKIKAHLTERRAFRLTDSILNLEQAIASNIVPNVQFNEAKDTINRAIEEATEAFLKTGPHNTKPTHHQTDWWLGAYQADAFVRGAHGVPAALKRAEKASGLKEYATFIRTALLPLSELLTTAKPLIVKKQNMPKVPTARELERQSATMTCQCCGGRYLANLGSMAHHGYQRPGGGWQTASCYGAKHLPFEVSRDTLGKMIRMLKHYKAKKQEALREAIREEHPLPLEYGDYSKKLQWNEERPMIKIMVTRKTFRKVKDEHAEGFRRSIRFTTFDEVKAADINERKAQIKSLAEDINAQEARYAGWTQTHTAFDKATEKWIAK